MRGGGDLPDFEVVLHLGQVKVWTETSLDGLECVVEEVETEIEHGTGQGLAVDDDAGLVEVPSSGSGRGTISLAAKWGGKTRRRTERGERQGSR